MGGGEGSGARGKKGAPQVSPRAVPEYSAWGDKGITSMPSAWLPYPLVNLGW